MNLMLIHGFSIEKSLYFIAEVVNMVSYLNRGLSVICLGIQSTPKALNHFTTINPFTLLRITILKGKLQ